MKKLSVFFVVGVALVGLIACATSRGTPIRPAPLSAERQADLRRTLAGNTWGVEYVTQTPNLQNKRKKKSQLKWTFEADGTGTMAMKLAENIPFRGGMEKSGPFDWKLKGKNLIMTTGDQTNYFRVETWSDEQMMWFDYEGEQYFIIYPIE